MGNTILVLCSMLLVMVEPIILDSFWKRISERKPKRPAERIAGWSIVIIGAFLGSLLLECFHLHGILAYIANNFSYVLYILYAIYYYD